jgi:SulP family sulfate permease
MLQGCKFNRLEVAGSLGDLGTLLPLAIGMILINGLQPTGLFLTIGIYYIIAGIYFGITVPVQPMKVIGSYAIATAMTASQITASGYLMGLILLIIGATGTVSLIGRFIPRSVIRGVQLSTGMLLMVEGVKMMLGTSTIQKIHQLAEPHFAIQSIGTIPIGILIGIAGGLLTLILLDNKRFPAGLVIVILGLMLGLILGSRKDLDQIRLGLTLPSLLPFGWPTGADVTFALFALVLPQIPMTLGNAVIAYTDLSTAYFKERSAKVTHKSACLSMALANFLSSTFGGMPLCHGAGGLAAHYRFGARTAGSNIIIGVIFVAMAIFIGNRSIAIINLLPLAVLGILLLFAGSQLGLTILDLKTRKELFVCLLILGITLAFNLAIGFMTGIAAAYLTKHKRIHV